MVEKRAKTVLLVVTFLFMILALRIAYYQLIKGKNLADAAASQRMMSTGVERPRGEILDRNGIPFTDRSIRHTIVLKPVFLKNKPEDLSGICRILGVDFDETQKRIKSLNGPLMFETGEDQAKEISSLKFNGVTSVNSLKRYDDETLARHVLGYLNKIDQIGQSGVEKNFNDALEFNGENSIGFITDAKKRLLEGLGYRLVKPVEPDTKLNIVLTLDYHIQQIVEDSMKRNGVTGAVVVEDVLSGDIVAIASKPDYDQNAVEKYLNSPNNELYNRAVASYNLGSIYKIIDAVLMLESGLDTEETYLCKGSITVGSRELKCSSYDKGGHGPVNLETAFAQSCNTYFIDRGLKLGYKSLINRAVDFGLGSTAIAAEQGIPESPGHLPDPGAFYSSGDIANIAIGQGEIMATPLQVADIVATVANGGIKNRVNVIDSICDQHGNKIRSVKSKGGIRVLDKSISERVKELMEEVTRTGTGTKANLEQYGGAAGKTGSAETGREGVVHAWFAGYFPLKNPKYSISVFVENGQLGGVAAAPVFAEIAAEIMKKGY